LPIPLCGSDLWTPMESIGLLKSETLNGGVANWRFRGHAGG
jgi:hypothetical protein